MFEQGKSQVKKKRINLIDNDVLLNLYRQI